MSAAEVLAAHQWRGGILGCECRWNWPEERTYFCGEDERIAKAHIAHQLDALKAAGYAVVELPKPTSGPDDDGQLFFGDYDIRADPTGSLAYRGVTTDFGLGSEVKRTLPIAAARQWGLNLLAAAQAADDGQLPMNTTDEEPQP